MIKLLTHLFVLGVYLLIMHFIGFEVAVVVGIVNIIMLMPVKNNID